MTDRDATLAQIDQYKSELAADPKSTVFVPLCDAYCEVGMIDDALEVALRGTWELPQNAEGFAAVGRVYALRDVEGKAEEAFYRALALDQMCVPAYKGLAQLLKMQGDVQKASDVLTKAIMLDPTDMSLQQMIESLGPVTTEVAPAEPTPVPADPAPPGPEPDVAAEPASEPAQEPKAGGMQPITTATIAQIYIEQGLYDKALEVYRELLADNPQDPMARQKIDEITDMMNGGAAAAVASATEPEPSAATPQDVVAVETPTPVAGGDVVGTLEKWLDAIQARRYSV